MHGHRQGIGYTVTPRILRVDERQMPGIGVGGVAEHLLFLSVKTTSTVLLRLSVRLLALAHASMLSISINLNWCEPLFSLHAHPDIRCTHTPHTRSRAAQHVHQ